MKRTVILVIILVVLGGVSAYMWSNSSEPQVDQTVAAQTETYTCSSCGNTFTLTIAEATEMYSKGTGVTCPSCNQAGAQKSDVVVQMGGLGLNSDEAAESEPEPENAAPTGGARRLNR